MHKTYFPMEGEYKVFTDDFKLIAEGFNESDANQFISEKTGQKVFDIYVVWNREFNWAHYGTFLGEQGLEEHKQEILSQGDGARVKKVKSILRE